MFKAFLLFLFFLAAATASACDARLYPLRKSPDDAAVPSHCPADLLGFAAQGGTTGGSGGPIVTVTNAAELTAAADRAGPLIILIAGTLSFEGQVAFRSDKTILGMGRDATLIGGGLDFSDASNMVVRNLILSKVRKSDAITVQRSHNVWIDHCDLSSDRDHDVDTYDGLADVTHGSEGVTISWTRFHDHFKTTLVGHSNSADAAAEDSGHLTVTYHHNLFVDTDTGIRVRFGRVHGFNNYFRRVKEYAFVSQMGAEVFVEKNVFEEVAVASPDYHPVTTMFLDPIEGLAKEQGSLYLGSNGTSLVTQTATWAPPYAYVSDSAASVPALVEACAGAGRIDDQLGL